jgi:hypothetical protein
MQTIEVSANEYETLTSFEDIQETSRIAEKRLPGHRFPHPKKRRKKRHYSEASFENFADNLVDSFSFKKAFKKVGGVLKKVGEESLAAPLIPMRPVMKKALTHKGVAVPKRIGTMKLAHLFYNNVVAKHGNYEQIHVDFDLDADNLVEDAASGIIKGILEFIKGLKHAKTKGEKLGVVEDMIAGGAATVESGLRDKQEMEQGGKMIRAGAPAIMADKKMIIVVVTVIVIILGIVWYKNQ